MMRNFSLLFIPAALFAQSATTTYQTDINGRRVAVGTQDNTGTGVSTQLTRSVNGRQIPAEQTTERVIREDANGKVVERTIQKFDFTGRPAGSERVMVEETPLAGGGKIVKETRAVKDLNGQYRPLERVTTETRISGRTTSTSVVVDTPSVNQDFKTTEKRSSVTTGPKGKEQTTETVDRPDMGGRFRTVARTETSVQAAGDKTTSNSAAYEIDALGKLVLSKQIVATTTKGPSGDVTETNIFSTVANGTTQNSGGQMRLSEQRVTEKRIAADGTVTEAVIVRTPNPSDPTKLGPAKTISETVCTGKCLPTPPATPAPTPAPAKP